MDAPTVSIRPLAARDSFDALTQLLHLAYAPLAAQGLALAAATQTPQATARRIAEGQCFVAECDGQLVGTITVCGPYAEGDAPWARALPALVERNTAHFHQFAVHPAQQGRGVGRALIAACEQWALERGYRRLAFEVALPGGALAALGARLGYASLGELKAAGRPFATRVMRKSLDRSALREHLETLARYHLWATRRLLAALDGVPEADYRRDLGLGFGSLHGALGQWLGAEQAWRARLDEAAPEAASQAAREPDRDRLHARVVEAALAWLPLLEAWPEDKLLGRLDHRSAEGRELALPFAAALAHVFDHAARQRGRLCAAMAMLGRSAPALDLVTMLEQENAPR